MLAWKPEDRITVDDALRHPYLATYHNPQEEPSCAPFDHSFEDKTQDLASLRGIGSHLLMAHVLAYNDSKKTMLMNPFKLFSSSFKL
jgi:hypothetical protein